MNDATREFHWPQGKRAAISLSFDDARPSQLDAGVPLLDRCAVKATFYVPPSRVGERIEDWKRAAANGHEIGNHSLRHSCSGNFGWKSRDVLENYTLERMEEELREANVQLENLLGVSPVSFAYPCGQTFVGRGVERKSYVPVVARQFLAGRGFRDEHFNPPWFCDLAKLGGTELDGLRFDQMVKIAGQAAERGLWVIFAGHDVGDESLHSGRQVTLAEDLERFCRYCTDAVNGIWIDTVAEIAAYVRENRGEA